MTIKVDSTLNMLFKNSYLTKIRLKNKIKGKQLFTLSAALVSRS